MTTEATPAAEPSFREQVETAETQDAAAPEEQVSETPEQQPEQKFVPLGALHEERQKRKNAEAMFRQRDQEYATWQRQADERLNVLHQLALQNQPQEQQPSFEQDPLTGTYREVQRVGQEVQTLKQDMQRTQLEQRQQQVVGRFVHDVESHERAFAQQAPDYYAAVNWAKQKKESEYVAVGFTEEQAHARVQQEATEIALGALQRGESPAHVGYRLAQAIGYQPQPNAQQKLSMQQDGRRASTPSGGSGHGGGRLSLDALAKMSGDDFRKATEGAAWKKLMGGK